MEKIYKVEVICKNCFKTSEQEIPYGQEAFRIIIQKECLTCGCKSLAQLEPRL